MESCVLLFMKGRGLMGRILLCLGLLIGCVLLIFGAIVVILNFCFIRFGNEKYSDSRRWKFVSWVASWSVPLLTSAKVEIDGLDKLDAVETGVIYANHQSMFDIFAMVKGIKRPHGYVAKKEIGKVFMLKNAMKLIKCEFLDREDVRGSVRVINSAVKTVKTGHLMVIFPEGTREINAPMGTFKAGSFKIATKSQADIIPLTIYNSYEVAKRWPLRTKIKIKIHDPISYSSYAELSTHEIADKVEHIVKADLL